MAADFKELLQEYSQRADSYLRAVLQAEPQQRSRTFLYVQLRGYVCSKFMLEPDECASDSLTALSEASVAKVARIPQGEVAERDLSMNCAGISSVETKKILLIIALSRALGIKLPPSLATEAETVDDLAAAVETALAAQKT